MNKLSKKKPTAHLICGFIGAGKTTFAKKLEKETGALRFTKDEWMIRIFGNNLRKIDGFETYDDRMVALITDVAIECLKTEINVIIDDGFWVRSQREEVYNQIKELGANYKLYYIKCPDDICKQRTIQRSENPSEDSFIIDAPMFDSYKKFFEAPSDDEEYLEIENH